MSVWDDIFADPRVRGPLRQENVARIQADPDWQTPLAVSFDRTDGLSRIGRGRWLYDVAEEEAGSMTLPKKSAHDEARRTSPEP